MKLSPRESVLALVTVAAALFGGSALLVSPQIDKWKALRAEWRDAQGDIGASRQLVESRASWEKRYQQAAQVVPQSPTTGKMDAHWLNMMDNLAARHGVNISKRQALDEKRIGLLHEQPIKCQEWEGSLDAFVHFLYDLQFEGAMLDVREVMIKPKGDGRLRGSFLLHCAYTRPRPAEPAAPNDSKTINTKKQAGKP